MSRSRLEGLLLSLGSGLGLALAFPSYDLPLLAWVSVAGLMLASVGGSLRRAALSGFLHGAVLYTTTLPWVYGVMRVHGGLSLAPAAGVMALVVAAAALFPAGFALGVAWLGRNGVARACFAAPFLWVALEFTRAHLPALGFPWNLLGYAPSGNLALLQLAPFAGIWGLSFLVAAYNALLARVVLETDPGRRHVLGWGALVATLLLVLGAAFGPRWVPRESPRHVARLVQTNFPQSPAYPADWMDQHAAELDELERLSRAAGGNAPRLVIWPEVPAPFSLQDPKFAARAERIARTTRVGFLAGVVDWKPGPRGSLTPSNSAALLDLHGRAVFLYDKIHLVAFGEYVPLRRWLRFADKLTAEVGDFQPGVESKVGEVPGDGSAEQRQFGVFICYEAVFPDEVRRFVVNGADLLVTLSNDGWFGRSSAGAQHLMMARVRAVENRRWLLRVTNTGYTVAVDPYGRYVARLAPEVRDALDAPYDFRSGLTPYARWGDWLPWLSIAVVVAAGVRKLQIHEQRKMRV